MSTTSTQTMSEAAAQARTAAAVDLKLEVVNLPVADVERAKHFYEKLGWRLDADFSGEGWRAVQFTPPGSPTSVHFGSGVPTPPPGSAQGMFLVVENIDAAVADLRSKGVEVSDPFHYAGIRGPRLPGPDPERRTYASYSAFSDPDGNGWVLQEITTRLPGRGNPLDVATLTTLLREAEENHGAYERSAPKHHWSDWYAPFIIAREQGKTADEAAKESGRHMESLRR